VKKIVIINLNPILECVISTAVIKGLSTEYPDCELYVVTLEKSLDIFKYNKRIHCCTTLEEAISSGVTKEKFELLVNMTMDFQNNMSIFNADKFIGFNFDEESEKIKEHLYQGQRTNKNIFQIFYNLCGLTWKGQGPNLSYYPKTKTQKNIIGLSIANPNIKKYISNKLNLNYSKVKFVNYKQNIFKKCDEINKHEIILTDDFLTMLVSLYLRKKILFLKSLNYNFRIELLGSGEMIEIPSFIASMSD